MKEKKLLNENAQLYPKLTNSSFLGIDILKFILAIFVVAIHTQLFKNANSLILSRIQTYVFSLAVPCFFTISGFLLFYKSKDSCLSDSSVLESIKKMILKMMRTYFVWSLIYIPLSIYGYLQEGKSIGNMIFWYFKDFLFIGEHFFSWHLWYLLSLIFGLCILYFPLKIFGKEKLCPLLFLILGVVSYRLIDEIPFMIQHRESYGTIVKILIELLSRTVVTGRLFTSIPYLLLGMLMARSSVLRSIPSKFRGACFGFLFGIYFLYPFDFGYLCIRPLVVFSCVWFVHSISLSNTYSTNLYRKLSMDLYYSHMLFYFFYCFLHHDFSSSGWKPFLVVLICSLVFSFLLNKINSFDENNKINFLKKANPFHIFPRNKLYKEKNL